jgi:hypothetical protein
MSALAAGIIAAAALGLVALAIVRGAARSRRQREHGERRRWHAERLADLVRLYERDRARWRIRDRAGPLADLSRPTAGEILRGETDRTDKEGH